MPIDTAAPGRAVLIHPAGLAILAPAERVAAIFRVDVAIIASLASLNYPIAAYVLYLALPATTGVADSPRHTLVGVDAGISDIHLAEDITTIVVDKIAIVARLAVFLAPVATGVRRRADVDCGVAKPVDAIRWGRAGRSRLSDASRATSIPSDKVPIITALNTLNRAVAASVRRATTAGRDIAHANALLRTGASRAILTGAGGTAAIAAAQVSVITPLAGIECTISAHSARRTNQRVRVTDQGIAIGVCCAPLPNLEQTKPAATIPTDDIAIVTTFDALNEPIATAHGRLTIARAKGIANIDSTLVRSGACATQVLDAGRATVAGNAIAVVTAFRGVHNSIATGGGRHTEASPCQVAKTGLALAIGATLRAVFPQTPCRAPIVVPQVAVIAAFGSFDGTVSALANGFTFKTILKITDFKHWITP